MNKLVEDGYEKNGEEYVKEYDKRQEEKKQEREKKLQKGKETKIDPRYHKEKEENDR